MAFSEKRACLWHAFDALADKDGTCIKSKLKVLTHNLATYLGFMKVEEEIDAYCSENTMTFDEYTEFLNKHVFSKLEECDITNSNADLDKVDEVCWMLCGKPFLKQENSLVANVSPHDIYKLWRIFNFLAEPGSGGDVLCPVVVDIEELALLVQRLCIVLGNITDTSQLEERSDLTVHCDFADTLKVLGEFCCQDCNPEVLSAAIQDIYDELVVHVIKKGYLLKRGHKITNWKEKWFVLTPKKLSYYTSREEVDMKGEWKLSPKCSVQPKCNSGSSSIKYLPSPKFVILMDKPGAKLNRFLLKCEGKDNEFSAPDVKSSSEWISALKHAIDLNAKPMSPQKAAFLKRRNVREQKREKKREEAERRKEELELAEKTRQLLSAEQQARAEAEARLAESRKEELDLAEKTRQLLLAEQQARAEAEARLAAEQKANEIEAQRIRELEEAQRELEALLEEERQAKRDEEIVRNLQSRILEEQFQKSERLEKLQAQMEQDLMEERQKRENLEELKSQQEELLMQEQEQLERLELERRANEERLEEALKKLQDADKSKQKLQEKILEVKKGKKFGNFSLDMPDVFISHRGRGAFPTSPQVNISRSNYSRSDSLKEKSPLGALDFKDTSDHLGSDSEKENVMNNSLDQ